MTDALLTEQEVAKHLDYVERIRLRAARIAEIRATKRAAKLATEFAELQAARLAAMTIGQRIVEKYIDDIAWGDRNNNIDFTDDLARDIDAAIKAGAH